MKLLFSSTITLAVLSVASSASTETADCYNKCMKKWDYSFCRDRCIRRRKWDDDDAEGVIEANDNKMTVADTLKHYFTTLSKEDGSEVSSLSALMCRVFHVVSHL
jgi:hypothetical protein